MFPKYLFNTNFCAIVIVKIFKCFFHLLVVFQKKNFNYNNLPGGVISQSDNWESGRQAEVWGHALVCRRLV